MVSFMSIAKGNQFGWFELEELPTCHRCDSVFGLVRYNSESEDESSRNLRCVGCPKCDDAAFIISGLIEIGGN